VFDLIVRGNMNKQIAATLGTTERTIKAHRHGVMESAFVVSRTVEADSFGDRGKGPLAGRNWNDYRSLCNQSPLRGTTFSGVETEAADDEVVR
jgi:Bacterial regulatory proteins, luxR family